MHNPMTENEYVEGRGLKCPVCRSSRVDAGGLDFDGDIGSYSDVSCRDCNAYWTEYFTMTGYGELIADDGTAIEIPESEPPERSH